MPKLKDKNVLVTGGAGFIGSHLLERISQEQPAKLAAVDNLFLGDEANLDEFLKKPKKFIKKTKMSFGGVKKDKKRANLIEYLATLK